MTDTVRDERDAFEAWYCADAAKSGLEFWPADIAAMRDGDEYGSQRVAINSKWEGWQARAMLAASPQGEGSSGDAPVDAVAWRWLPLLKGKKEPWMEGDATPWVYWTGSAKPDFSACPAGDIIDLQPLYAHPAPIKPSADTGELRERVAKLIDEKGRLDLTAGFPPFGFIDNPRELADAILNLIQSERAGSPIGQNDKPGLAFSDAGEP